jgi:hypothetical protein
MFYHFNLVIVNALLLEFLELGGHLPHEKCNPLFDQFLKVSYFFCMIV